MLRLFEEALGLTAFPGASSNPNGPLSAPIDMADFFTSGSTGSVGVASCTISVTLKPTAAGTRKATLTSLATSQTVRLGGIAAAPFILLGTSLIFPLTPLGRTSTLTLTVTNPVGNIPLAISAATAQPFAASPAAACGSLAAGSSCSILVTFSPTTIGPQTGTLTVSDQAAGSAQTVSLTGIE